MYVCVVACLAEVIMCMFVFQKWGTQQHPNPLFFMYRKTIGLGDPVQKPYLYRSINGWSIYRVCFKNCAHPWNDIVKTYLYIDQPWNFRVLYTIFQINPDTSIIYIYMSVDISFFEIIHYMMPWVYHGVPIITWVNIPSSPHWNSFHAGCSATALASFGGEGSQCPIEKIRNHAI